MPAPGATGPLPPTFVAGFHDEAAVRRMPYRQLGSRLVSQLSYGASALGGVFGSSAAAGEARELVHTAIAQGINLVDVAPWYGHGAAESALGAALVGVPRAAYYLTTKVGRYKPGALEMFDFSYARTLRSVDESLERLGVTYLDTVQVHDPEFAPDPAVYDVVVRETLPALAECVRRGTVRAIGITGYPLDFMLALAERAAAAGLRVESALTYSHFCLHDTSLVEGGALAALAARGVGVLNGSPLSMALLTAAGAPAWHPARPELKARAAAAAAHCAAAGASIERLAVAFALAQPDIPTTLFSTTKVAKLRANLDLATGAAPLSEAERALLAELRPRFFSGEGYEALRSWEGVETVKVWAKIGKALLADWYQRRAGAVTSGGAADLAASASDALSAGAAAQPAERT